MAETSTQPTSLYNLITRKTAFDWIRSYPILQLALEYSLETKLTEPVKKSYVERYAKIIEGHGNEEYKKIIESEDLATKADTLLKQLLEVSEHLMTGKALELSTETKKSLLFGTIMFLIGRDGANEKVISDALTKYSNLLDGQSEKEVLNRIMNNSPTIVFGSDSEGKKTNPAEVEIIVKSKLDTLESEWFAFTKSTGNLLRSLKVKINLEIFKDIDAKGIKKAKALYSEQTWDKILKEGTKKKTSSTKK